MPASLTGRPPARLRLAPALVIAALLCGTLASVVGAQDIPRLEGRVTDLVGVVDDPAAAEAAIARLQDEANIDLFALFVDTTGDLVVTDYADEVAAQNSLGGNDALLLLAIDDRRDAMWVGPLLDDISDQQIDSILADWVEPMLRDGDFTAAIVAAADGLIDARGGGPVQPTPTPVPGGGTAPPPSGGGGADWLLGMALVGIGAVIIWVWFARRRRQHLAVEERDRRTGALAREANALLLQIDEELRQNEQELGFAEAQFGADEAERFREVLTAAGAELQAAFTLRQQLDDDIPEDAETRERMLTEIVERCRRAQELVEEQSERFRELRDLERRAPEIIEREAARTDVIAARLPEAQTKLAELEQDGRSGWQSLRGNVAEATGRLDLARQLAQAGHEALEKEERGAAARSAKALQDALGQAEQLLGAIDRVHAGLVTARQHIDEELRAATTDVDAARRTLETSGDKTQAAALAEAEAKLEAARRAMSATPADVLGAYAWAVEANAAADVVLAAIREGVERRAKAQAAYAAASEGAQLSIMRATEFLAGRRQGIGRVPRTRLAEAQRHLDTARATVETDPARAADEARQATRLADDAYRLASDEFERHERSRGRGTILVNGEPFGGGSGGSRRGWGEDMTGAIIGGIIGGILSGGGGRRGGGIGGIGRIGGFGGGGGGGRSIGGGFRGGGGRSRGGGW